jgi:FtsP/CotA-like multicopper oxidase with cupredoxin domain
MPDRGDQVIVHFTNELPEPTTIHWHGIRVPNAADGSDHTQQPIPSGGTFGSHVGAVAVP